MTREERIKALAAEAFEVSEREKELKRKKEELRDEIFRLATRDYDHKEYLLPIKTIEVPASFWEATEMTNQEFVDSRFPGWNVEHVEKNISDGSVVFVLKKDPNYMPSVIDLENNVRVSKSVTEYSPEIDWDSLAVEFPEIYTEISSPVMSVELNEQAFEQKVTQEPDILAKIQRHLKTKQPSLRMTARKLQDGQE